MTMRIGFLHAAAASIAPVNEAVARLHPDWDPINLLDDGLQRHFHAGDNRAVAQRLSDLARIAAVKYGAQALLVTCSAAPLETVEAIGQARGIPCLKIDFPMCDIAVRKPQTIGVVVSFRPTEAVTRATLDEAARRAGTQPQYLFRAAPDAFRLLHQGDRAAHDAIITAEVEQLVQAGARTVVLAQVSMAHLGAPLTQRFGVPVLESLTTSLEAIASRRRSG